jgi:cell division protein FtsQ
MPRLALRLGRAPVLVLVFAGLAGLLYLVARETSMFALRTVEVAGAPAEVERSVRAELEPLLGTSLVSISEGDLEGRLLRLPAVRSASVDRDFPGTLRVVVRPERPVAILRRGEEGWVIAASGRVIRTAGLGELSRLPRVWLPAVGDPLEPGAVLLDEQGAQSVHALARVPADFPARVVSGRGTRDDLTLVFGEKTELRLGGATEIRLKLEVAATVLRSLSGAERDALAYLDVSIPTRSVAAAKPQVATSA